NRVDGVRGQKFVTQAGDVESDKKTGDRKSTRLNSSHTSISYAVFCLDKRLGADGLGGVVRADDDHAGGERRWRLPARLHADSFDVFCKQPGNRGFAALPLVAALRP